MPKSLAIGVPYDVFWHLNPKKLTPFIEADKEIRRKKDEDMWTMGMYIRSAILSSLDKKNSYPKYPFSYGKDGNGISSDGNSQTLSEEEKKKRTEMLFAQLNIMAVNYNLEHKTVQDKAVE